MNRKKKKVDKKMQSKRIRQEHQSRDWKNRNADELTTEPYAKTLDQWQKDPDKYDYPGIDDNIPEGYRVEKKSKKRWVLYNEKNEIVGHVSFEKGILKSIRIDIEYRGRKLSNYLLREITKDADKHQEIIRLRAVPLSIELETLVSYYKQFGFVKDEEGFHGKNFYDMIRYPIEEQKNDE